MKLLWPSAQTKLTTWLCVCLFSFICRLSCFPLSSNVRAGCRIRLCRVLIIERMLSAWEVKGFFLHILKQTSLKIVFSALLHMVNFCPDVVRSPQFAFTLYGLQCSSKHCALKVDFSSLYFFLIFNSLLCKKQVTRCIPQIDSSYFSVHSL